MARSSRKAEQPEAVGFCYRSPWLPCKSGWWCIGHADNKLWRWRFLQEHTRNEATGERFVLWHLFEDYSRTPSTLNRADQWSLPPVELRPNPHDLTSAEEAVAQRWLSYSQGRVP